MKKKLLTLVAPMLVSALALAFTACGKPKPSGPAAAVVAAADIPAFPAFSITVNGAAVTDAVLSRCTMYSATAKSVNSKGTESEHAYVGFAFKDVLSAAGLTGSYTSLVATASDGYQVTLTGYIIYDNSTLLAVTKDGAAFVALPWLAPCGDTVSGDYVQNVATIVVS